MMFTKVHDMPTIQGGGGERGPFLYLSAPLLANVSTISLLVIHVCARTFCMVHFCLV